MYNMFAFVTVGAPGSGKSTWAKSLGEFYEVNLDDFRKLVSNSESNQAATGEAVKLRDETLNWLGLAYKNIVISDTNANVTHRTKLLEHLKELGYTTIVTLMKADLETCLERNQNRNRVVPEYAVRRIYNEIDSQHQLFDNCASAWKADSFLYVN